MKVLYLIQTFKGLDQIVRLVRTIRQSDPSGTVLISHNRQYFTLEPSAFAGLTDVHLLNVLNGSRLDFSLPGSYIGALEYARSQGLDFDWVVNMTGQCYPVRPLKEFTNLLDSTDVDGFIDHHRVFDEKGKASGIWSDEEAHGRYHYQYHWRLTRREPSVFLRKGLGVVRVLLNKMQTWVRFDTSYALQIGLRDRSTIINPSFPLFGGSYYMTLSRRAADYLCDFTQANPRIRNYFSRMNIPSEVYPHTVLVNNPDLKLSGYQHFFFDAGQNKRGRLSVLGVNDLDRIAASGAFFARKFEPTIDREVLVRLDQRVLGRSQVLTNIYVD